MEFSLPELTRCILRTSTHDDYKRVIDHAPGTFSLQEAIAKDYSTLYLGQVLPATNHYSQLTIIDLLPTTRALLTHNASTFVVLAPEATLENERRLGNVHECASLSTEHVDVRDTAIKKESAVESVYNLEEDAILYELNAERIVVQLNEHLPSHVCCANEEFMQRIACVFDSDDDDNNNNISDDNIHKKDNYINEHVKSNGCTNVEGETKDQTHKITSFMLKYNDRLPYLISIGESVRRFVFVFYPLIKNCDLHDCNLCDICEVNVMNSRKIDNDYKCMYLYAGQDAFRNIRAACLRDASYQSHINTWNRQLPFQPFSLSSSSSVPTNKIVTATKKSEGNDHFNMYYTNTFAIPADMCSVVFSSMNDDALQSTKQAMAQKVSLCCAIDNFIMTNTYGEEYADLLSTVMLQCASQLNGRLVNVGDVITLRLSSSTLNATHEFDNGERVVEVAWNTLEHYCEKGDAVWASTAESSECTEIIFPMRVTEVVPCSLHDTLHETEHEDEMCECEYSNPFGIIILPVSVQNGEANAKDTNELQTEIRLVSQSAFTNNWDVSPLYVRCRESASSCETHGNTLYSLDIVQQLRELVNKYFTPSTTFDMLTSRFNAPLVLVVHGIRQNLCHEFVHHVLEQVGIPMAVASVEGLKEEELEELLHKFSSQCSGPAALILHHAERLHDEYTHLLSLIHSSSPSTTLLSSHSASAHVHPWQTDIITSNDDNDTNKEVKQENKESDDTKRNSISGIKIIVLLCESVEAVAPALAACATNASGVIECGNPSEEDRQLFLTYYLDALCDKYHVHQSMLLSMSSLAAWTVGLTYADLRAFACECVCTVAQKWRVCSYSSNININISTTREGLNNYFSVLSEADCETCLQQFMRAHGHNLVSTKLQPVRWSDVGGLDDAKRELRETIQLPLLYPELFNTGMKKRSGILFYGPPGCGKTLLAKAVATEMNMNFMSVKGPELINQYVGESEKNIRLLFQRARDNSPCIVFFDELDALAPARGAKGDAGGAMDRIVAQLLVEVDGVGQSRSDGAESGDIFIIGATNRPDLLDPSLLRPGRFDRLCYLGIPATRQEQLYALRALTRKFTLNSNVDFDELLLPLDCVYTGADFFALCSDAMMFAVEDALEAMRENTTKLATNCFDQSIKANEHMEHDTSTYSDHSALQLQQNNGHGDKTTGKNKEAKEEDYEESDDSGNSKESVIVVNMSHFLRARDQLKPSVTREDLRRYESMKTKFNTK